MKTPGMQHQLEGVRRAAGRKGFAFLCEQGTGKTWMFLAVAEQRYAAGEIDGLLVVAPKGVHINWVQREIPAHLEAPHIAAWYSANATAKNQRQIERLFALHSEDSVAPLRVLAINYDALITRAGMELARRFLNAMRCMMVLDESQRIKNPRSARTKAVLALGTHAVARFIGTGTPITNAPTDAFAQFEFIESGLLGTTSYRAFVAEYAELVPENSRLMDHVRRRIANKRFLPQIVKTDELGRKQWRNLDKLQSLIAAHSYRVLKRECLTLPEKIYTVRYFELTPRQQRLYDEAQRQLRVEIGGDAVIFKKLNAGVKLQQITSGFILSYDGKPLLLGPQDNPRLEALLDWTEDIDGQFIVWARFTEEIRQIQAALEQRGISVGAYYGETKEQERIALVDAFQAGEVRAIVGHAQSGGTGLTLTAARHVLYYSHDWSLENRLQSEDRVHRIGTRRNVVYTDLAAAGTIDETIVAALQRKEDVAAAVLGDLMSGESR